MKRRMGFVANSSASSFIIAIAKIINREKFDAFLNSIDTRAISGLNFYSVKEIDEDRPRDVKSYNDKYEVDAFDGTCVQLKKEDFAKEEENLDVVTKAMRSLAGSNEKNILVWRTTSEDIDYDSDTDEYQYDIDLDHFDIDDQKLYEGLCEENGVVLVDKNFGSGYNG